MLAIWVKVRIKPELLSKERVGASLGENYVKMGLLSTLLAKPALADTVQDRLRHHAARRVSRAQEQYVVDPGFHVFISRASERSKPRP
jgi:hypothetical protein